MMEKHNLEERILGILMGISIGTVIGFLLHERERKHPRRERALPR